MKKEISHITYVIKKKRISTWFPQLVKKTNDFYELFDSKEFALFPVNIFNFFAVIFEKKNHNRKILTNVAWCAEINLNLSLFLTLFCELLNSNGTSSSVFL